MKDAILKLIEEIKRLSNDEGNALSKKIDSRFDFHSNIEYKKRQIKDKVEKLKEQLWLVGCHYSDNKDREDVLFELLNINRRLIFNEELLNNLEKIKKGINRLTIKSSVNNVLQLKTPKLPHDIREEVILDIKEMQNAFNNSCHRAAIILCGRILETCLHRKYYEATGNDILEKNPGIGLGNLIRKLEEKSVILDPGLKQQAHLINNVRIHSVHKKKEMFIPSYQQTYAMILYTMDMVERLF